MSSEVVLRPAESKRHAAVREMRESETRTGREGSEDEEGGGVSACVCWSCP